MRSSCFLLLTLSLIAWAEDTAPRFEHLSPYGVPKPLLITSKELPKDFPDLAAALVIQIGKDAAPIGFEFLKGATDSPSPGKVGVFVPPEAVLKFDKRTISNVGEGAILIRLAKSVRREARTIEVEGKRTADYNELRRAAYERLIGSPFPPEKVALPIVEKGTLVIVGGGGTTKEINDRFIAAGGGENGYLISIPISSPDPINIGKEENFLKKMGAKNITVVPYREQKDLEDPKIIDAFKKATGVWFGGGRQWNFVDGYEGTKLEPLIKDVLKRGGVIGGSSAGATIQGDYLVRGAPAGPNIMMCEGYERGFAYLPGVAIDQHFTARNRFKDMTALMKVYPQYLGIGLDESTAIIVQGSTAEILGKAKVHFYDRRKKTKEGEPDYEAYPAGTKYDLINRKVLETKK
jgi:cyanophycinase